MLETTKYIKNIRSHNSRDKIIRPRPNTTKNVYVSKYLYIALTAISIRRRVRATFSIV